MTMWKIGLIGAGYWSSRHLQAWQMIPNVMVTALCDPDLAKLSEKAHLYNIPEESLYLSAEEMVKEAEIDIVDVVTGPESHVALVELAAKAGKHVLCQKPFARTLEEGARMVAFAKQAGVRLMVTENWRWLEPFRCIKEMLNSGVIGAIHTVRYVHTDFYTPRMEPTVKLPQPVFREMPRLLFYEMGAHWFDVWRFLFGMPKRVYAELSQVSPYIAGEDNGIVVLGHEGFHGYMDMSWATRQQLDRPLSDSVAPVHLERLVIDGREGTLKLYTNGDISLINQHGSEERWIKHGTTLDHEESHVRLQTHFIECLNAGVDFDTSGADNMETLRLLFSVYESAEKHVAVYLAQ
ncbi:Gfo/Idh/MocA family oxidoreductase [Paenibacillus oryzisoli]|uniref:Gfo/Idh/MocA family protein n=1 Tax=Paenibacillus oryzisoli TaxID=1850517 RepID=UPI003D29F2B2